MAETDMLKLESAVCDAEGAALLLDLAIEDLGQGESSWKLLGVDPWPSYKLFMLTEAQWTAVIYANSLVYSTARNARVVFYGPDEDGSK